jgi:hypothetical protein
MGKDVKPSSGGIWRWLKEAFVGVAKSGAFSETWKFIAPWVVAAIAASATTLLGIAQQAPALAIVAVSAVVFAAVAFGAVKVQAFLDKRRASEPAPQPEDEAPPTPALARLQGYELTEANLDGLERVARALADGITVRHDPIADHLRRIADRPAPPPKRDVSLGEGMLYVLRGEWGLDFTDFDRRNDSYDLETIKWLFEEMAEDARIQVWGSDAWVEGRYTKIEPDQWKHLKIEWTSLTEGKPRAASKNDINSIEPHYNLMVNKSQIEEQFPDVPLTPARLNRETREPSPQSIGDELESAAPEEELEKGLYVGVIVLDAAKIESQHLIEIGIVGFNGSGRAACVSSVRGSVRAIFKTREGDETEELDLPTPRLLTDRSNTDFMPHHTEFLIVLEQVLRPGAPERLLAAFEHGPIIFDLDDVEIQMKSCRRDEPDVFARLKLWNGAVLRQASGFSTHKQHKLRPQSVTLGQATLGDP